MISIIVPVYNVESYLSQCLDCLVHQTIKDIEIILIDDASTDQSGKICDKYSKKYSYIRVFHQKKNGGVSASRNLGIEMANGKYIAFVDSDDQVELDMYENLLKNLEYEDADLSICHFQKSNERKNESTDFFVQTLTRNQLFEQITGQGAIQGFVWNKLYKTEIIKKNHLKFDVNIFICEDFLFNCQYISNICSGVVDSRKFYYYVQRENSAYNGVYRPEWESVLDAYQKIFKIYEEYYDIDYIGLKYNYLIANLDLKEKVCLARSKTDKMNEITCNINSCLKDVLRSNFTSFPDKIKIYLKANCMRLFLFLKHLKIVKGNLQ